MHKCIGQLTIVGHQQQTERIDIQPSNRNPSTVVQTRQVVEDGSSFFRVVTCGNFTQRLVIEKNTTQILIVRDDLVESPLDHQIIVEFGTIAQLGGLPVYPNFASRNPGFQLTP